MAFRLTASSTSSSSSRVAIYVIESIGFVTALTERPLSYQVKVKEEMKHSIKNNSMYEDASSKCNN